MLALVTVACLAVAPGCTRDVEPEADRPTTSLASGGGGVPLGNRMGVPTTGGPEAAMFAHRGLAAEDGEDEEPKDYWADIPFDRSNFEEVRNFVRDRYIEANVDETRAYAQAASFALASDEERVLLLLPEAFHAARANHPDEKGRLSGKVHKLRPQDRFVVVEQVEATEEEKRRLSDDEIRELRAKDKARTRLLDKTWAATRFGARDFERVMDFASRELGKHPKWTMKKAWVSGAQGYLYSLDPHSSLIAKAAWEDSTKEITDSSFEGIGAILTQRPGSEYTIVESPIAGQPAVQAGLHAGDVIKRVDGADIKGELLPKVVSRIRGPKATTVVLTVERVGMPEEIDIPIVRSRIDIKNVQGQLVEGYDDIGYIKVTGFVPTTDLELGRLYRELSAQARSGRLRGLILDLRNNSGGLLKQGINVADRFLRDGVVVTVKNRNEADEVYRAEPDGTWDTPLVVLVDDGAASASEIVASAIQDNGRGLIVGDRTFGKASVQTLFSPLLRDDYYIKLTVARYYSPSGRTLQVVGVQPDVETPPEVDGKMPLGFREENLSHHLAPQDAAYLSRNQAWAKTVGACADAFDRARLLWKADPNPAVKFDYQMMRGADLLECMVDPRAARSGGRR